MYLLSFELVYVGACDERIVLYEFSAYNHIVEIKISYPIGIHSKLGQDEVVFKTA